MVDFNASMAGLVNQITHQVPDLGHIRPEQVLISATFNRSSRRSGLLAYVLPLKYRAGSPIERRIRGSKEYHWAMLPLLRDGREILYIIYFMLPRFLHLSARERLETVIHELYHISPEFNGDLRRFPGRSALHGSMKQYDATVRTLTDRFIDGRSADELNALLQHREPEALSAHHVPEPRPKLLKVALASPKSGLTY